MSVVSVRRAMDRGCSGAAVRWMNVLGLLLVFAGRRRRRSFFLAYFLAFGMGVVLARWMDA